MTHVADDEPGVVEAVASHGHVDRPAHVVDADRVPATVDEELGVRPAAAAEVDGTAAAFGTVGLLPVEKALEDRETAAACLLPRSDPGAIGSGVTDSHGAVLT